MGWKGTLRSLQAEHRRYQREARRRQRELERQRAQVERMQERERAAYEVEVYENYIGVLLSVHKDCGDSWDWSAIHLAPPPAKPERTDKEERAAQSRLDAFKPGLGDKLLRRTESKREGLTQSVKWAKESDERAYSQALKAYERAYADWETSRDLASQVLAGDPEGYYEALRQAEPFKEISELGSSVGFAINDGALVEAVLHVNSEEVIPGDTKTLLKSGKLSVKKMTKTRFYELYQDYVCGCILRVARELFAFLPIKAAIVTAVGMLLNAQTGHMEEQPILSAAIPRETLEALNFDMLDPSDAMGNFVHRMKFMKTKGFQAVENLSPEDAELVE